MPALSIVIALAALGGGAAAFIAARHRTMRLAGVPRLKAVLVKHPAATTLAGPGEVIIALPKQGEGLALNAVAARCWELMDGTRSVIDIARDIAREYRVPLSEGVREVRTFVLRIKQSLLALEAGEWALAHVHFQDIFSGIPGEGLREIRLSRSLIVHTAECLIAPDGALRPWAGTRSDRRDAARAMEAHRAREAPLETAALDFQRGWDLCAGGNLAAAETSFRRCAETAPDWADAHYQLGYVLLRLKRFEEAIRSLSRADSLRPGLFMVREYLDQAHRMAAGALSHEAFVICDRANAAGLRDPDAAIRELRRALEITPRYPSARLVLARAWEKKDRYDLALAELGRALEADPDPATLCQALYSRGVIFMAQGRSDMAMRDWEKAIQINGSPGATTSAISHMASSAVPH